MTIGIIGAMDEEIEIIVQEMTNKEETTIANCLFVKGNLRGQEIVLLKSGIGKVNAAMSTTILMERFSPDYVINTGSAGGFAKQLDVGDVVISNEVVHHDVDVTAFDYAYGQVPGMPATFQADPSLIQKAIKAVEQIDIQGEIGLIATADSFMDDPERVNFVREKFPALIAAEMEAAAVAQVCHQYNCPFVVIRALSDIAGKESSVSFDAFLKTAAKNASEIIFHMLEA
ncbi:5'-methylthioadenosine/S-adenosylhomocysteine nucleosidase [Ornithinibacillus halotolerans]|uniref:5'-methylthioadenosine/S-adenosylhomocysteine nucleosidase n=1 Tax=Ornithinibacillus halotolerans TaxID=1274357 RepID=A0A916W5Q8_9BACI|nr:5'-methylthioadenosine/S-adenosylhomocysteine nucleosidase [Ornithinibacillus halotolerans]GGA69026.1 5'-methylthioadenosine/S-adenosylhomocysteine nucleosidase [Ornithinibacillus halotolerans]